MIIAGLRTHTHTHTHTHKQIKNKKTYLLLLLSNISVKYLSCFFVKKMFYFDKIIIISQVLLSYIRTHRDAFFTL